MQLRTRRRSSPAAGRPIVPAGVRCGSVFCCRVRPVPSNCHQHWQKVAQTEPLCQLFWRMQSLFPLRRHFRSGPAKGYSRTVPDGYGNAQGRDRESGSRRMAAVAVWRSVQEKTGGPKEAFPDAVLWMRFLWVNFFLTPFVWEFLKAFSGRGLGAFFRACFPEQGFPARLLFRMNGLAPSRS